MLSEELGLEVKGTDPLRAGLATFVAFLVVGLVPLIPFVVPDLPTSTRFLASAVATGMAFFGVGAAKGLVLGRSTLRSGLDTLLTGGAAAAIAFVIGAWLHQSPSLCVLLSLHYHNLTVSVSDDRIGDAAHND